MLPNSKFLCRRRKERATTEFSVFTGLLVGTRIQIHAQGKSSDLVGSVGIGDDLQFVTWSI